MRSRSLIVALLAALSLVLAAPRAFAGERVALAIGVSAYRSSPLPSPVKDATEVAQTLAGFGFSVTLAKDPNSEDFKAAVNAFVAKARGAEAAVVYFSGHGLQVNGEVYMMASDTRADRPEIFQRDDFTVNGILDRLQAAGVDFKFVIVDACRGNPFLDADGRTALATANAGRAERRRPATNALVSFASASGQLSQDWGGSIGLSLYTSALLEVMRRNERIEVRDLTQQTRALVEQRVASRGASAQNPWEGSSLVRPIHFERRAAGPVVAFLADQERGSFDRRDGRMASLERQPRQPVARAAESDINVSRSSGQTGNRAWEYNVASVQDRDGSRAERRSALSSGGRYGMAEWR